MSALRLVAAGQYVREALLHRIGLERTQAAVTAVGAELTVGASGASIRAEPDMTGATCVLPAGAVARSIGVDERRQVMVPASDRPGTFPVGKVGYADVFDTWRSRTGLPVSVE